MYWEDRLTADEYKRYEAAILKFRAGRGPDKTAQSVLYDELAQAGLEDEEASEMCDLEVENWGAH